jgi:hypothetical protein
MDEQLLENAEPVKESPALDVTQYEDNSFGSDDCPEMYDPRWPDYVLGQLEEDERTPDGLPLTDGLRRLALKLLGPIVKSVPITIQAPNPNNDNHATVAWELQIAWDGDLNDVRTFGDVADVYTGNTKEEFAVHASATAATKAEGRALRKALNLKHTLVAEEVSEVPAEDPTKITTAQISFVDMLCQRNDVNVRKLLALSRKNKLDKIEDMPYAAAVAMCKYLAECQKGQNARGDKMEFPESIKGYESNWRQS